MNLRRQGETDSVSEIESVWMSRQNITCLRQLQCSKEKMGVDMTQDCQDITVHAVSFEHCGVPAFYASLPGDGETAKKCRANGAEDKNYLASILLDHLMAMENPLWKCRLVLDRAAFPVNVVRDPLGRPNLLLGEYRGPAISFSAGGGKVWAALCGNGSDIGIDVATADEFQGEYPFHRVFHDRELQHALRTDGGKSGKGIRPALVHQGSGCQGPGMCVPPCGAAASPDLSIDGGRRGVYFSRMAYRVKPRCGLPQASAGPFGCVRFPWRSSGFPSPS